MLIKIVNLYYFNLDFFFIKVVFFNRFYFVIVFMLKFDFCVIKLINYLDEKFWK